MTEAYKLGLRVTIKDCIKQIYSKYPTGGDLHIVLDDCNISDRHLLFCLNEVINDKELIGNPDRTLFTHCIGLLLVCTEEERNYIIQQTMDDID